MINFKLLLSALLILLISSVVLAQKSTIVGIVTDTDNSPLPGVSIIVVGYKRGITTDFDGKYSIKANLGDVLEFSYIGLEKTRVTIVGASKIINVVLKEDKNQLDEVVVTALGIKKEKKRIGFATQEVKGESLQKAISPNLVESLTGQVAGLTILNNSSEFFSNPGIFLRGEKPLIVVDGVPQPGSDFWDLSSDDIENITVLKGTAASALYGSLGANGAIQMTMKSGKGVGVFGTKYSFNSSTTFQTGFIRIPRAQTQYGPGSAGQYEYGGGTAGGDGLTKGGGKNDFDYSVWGPKFDGRLLAQYYSPIDPTTGKRKPIPWISRGKDNLANFMETGIVNSNNFTIQSNSKSGNFIISNTYKYSKASSPNQKLQVNTLRLRGNSILSKLINVDASLQWNKQFSDNRIKSEYGPNSAIYLINLWGGAHWDIRDFKHIWKKGKEGIEQDFVESWRYNNPYALVFKWRRPYNKNVITSYIKANFKISERLSTFARTTVNWYSVIDNQEISKSLYHYSFSDRGGRFRYNATRYFENNTDFLLTYNNKFFGNYLDLNASLGGNQRYLKKVKESASTSRLIIPELFTLQNSVEKVKPSSAKLYKGTYSAYTTLDLAFKNTFYLGLTGRVDKLSTLLAVNDTFFYPSVSLSTIVSELVELPEVTFFKVRGSYANVAGDFGEEDKHIYAAKSTFGVGTYRNRPYASTPDTLDNDQIRASRTESYEVGFETKLFKGRLGIDFSYYRTNYGPQIFTQDFSYASGYSGTKRNGKIHQRRGIDVSISAIPIRTENFRWSTLFNFDQNKKYLIQIPPLSDGTPQKADGRTKIGELINNYFTKMWERSPDGQLVIESNGLPSRASFVTNIGHQKPNFTASIINTFRYKNWSLSFLIDARVGGITQDRYERDLWRTGSHPDAIHPERELSNIAIAKGDKKGARTMLIKGVKIVSGKATYDSDGNTLTDTRKFASNNFKATYEDWARVYKAGWPTVVKEKTFAKLREVTLTYKLSPKILKNMFFDAISISFVGRNLLYWTKDDTFADFDAYSLKTGDPNLQMPSQRSLGVNINLKF